jgi:hypothetical protein
MSRRWYTSPDGRIVYVGWDRALQQFWLSIVALCGECGGMGEELGTEIPCMACLGEGVSRTAPTTNLGAARLDTIADALASEGIALLDAVRADLDKDRRTNAGDLVHDYGALC